MLFYSGLLRKRLDVITSAVGGQSGAAWRPCCCVLSAQPVEPESPCRDQRYNTTGTELRSSPAPLLLLRCSSTAPPPLPEALTHSPPALFCLPPGESLLSSLPSSIAQTEIWPWSWGSLAVVETDDSIWRLLIIASLQIWAVSWKINDTPGKLAVNVPATVRGESNIYLDISWQNICHWSNKAEPHRYLIKWNVFKVRRKRVAYCQSASLTAGLFLSGPNLMITFINLKKVKLTKGECEKL